MIRRPKLIACLSEAALLEPIRGLLTGAGNRRWAQALAVLVAFALPFLGYPWAQAQRSDERWERISGPAAAGDIRQILCSRADGRSNVYLSIVGQGVLLSEDGGRLWQTINERLPRGRLGSVAAGPVALAPDSAQLLLVGVSGQAAGGRPAVYKTRDGGRYWAARRGLGTEDVEALAIAPGGVVYAASGSALYRSADAGDTWQEAGRRPAASAVLSMAVDGYDSTVYIGTEADGLWRTVNGGKTWQAALPGHSVYTLAISAAGPVYAGTEDGLYASDDQGATWRKLPLDGGPVSALAVAPGSPDRLFASAGGQGPVFYSVDGGAAWRPLSHGLLGAPVTALAVDPESTQRLYVGTRQGLWRCMLPQ